ncbi:F-box domain protein [Aspergillus sp. HF37]|nr:F-box domain protein [Aspergillus sp. HF37]
MSVERLPDELLDHILSYLPSDPPSPAGLYRSPRLNIASSDSKDLKNASLVSRRLRELVLPSLFSHACLGLESEDEFLSFISRSGLARYVKSIVVTQGGAPNKQSNLFWWRRILRYLDPLRLTVVAATSFMGKMLGVEGANLDSWAFEIPFQIMHLEQTSRQRSPDQLSELEEQPSLLSSRPWTSLLFNEGSSLKAYNHYEYFHFQVPSLFNRWGLLSFGQPNVPWVAIRSSLDRLTSFHYVAVFPFYNHVSRVMSAVGMMNNLQSVSVQLAPSRSDNIEIEQKGSMNPSDPWMELETGYSIIAFTIANLGNRRCLGEFAARDYDGLRTELADVAGGPLGGAGWGHDGHGTWTRTVDM